MQMRWHIHAALFVSVYRQHLERKNFSGRLRRPHILRRKSAFLRNLPQRHRQKIRLPVRVSAEPRPRIIDIVISHQHLAARTIYDPSRRSHVRQPVLPGENVFARRQTFQNQRPIRRLLFIIWFIGFQLLYQHFFFCIQSAILSFHIYTAVCRATPTCSRPSLTEIRPNRPVLR